MRSHGPRPRRVSPAEWRFVAGVGALVVACTSIPYVLAALQAGNGRVFGGFVYAVEDGYSYLANMRQGAEGAWLFHIPYTSEPHPGALVYPFHLLLGKCARLLPGADLTARLVWTYHGARVIFGLVLLGMVYRFIAAFTDRPAVRRLAWLWVAIGGGLGWLLILVGQPGWLGSMPLDWILPEGFTFLVLYGFPHIALARTLLLGGMLALVRGWGGGTRPLGWGALAGLAWLLMGLIVPFYVAVAWAVIGATWAVECIVRRHVAWWDGLQASLAAAISLPALAYHAWLFTTQPVYAAWAAQNQIRSPHPLHYLAAYGLLLVLAALGLRRRARNPLRGAAPGRLLPLVWVAIVPALVYLPFNLQRRLAEGVQVPLSLLAALGLLSGRLRGPGLRLALSATFAALVLTPVLLVVGNCLALRGLPAPIYRDAGEVAVLDWLAGRVRSDDVVLSSYATGNYLPVRVGARAFVGHGPETVRSAQKRALAERFFAAASDDAWRRALLDEHGVDYVFWGPAERAGGADISSAPYLRPLYRDASGDTIVFEVLP
jgi:hypothetical protein